MGSDETPVPAEFINNQHIVFDVVYKPHQTRLLREAKAKGAKVIYGAEMLLHQGVEQFSLYTGASPPIEVMKKELWSHLT